MTAPARALTDDIARLFARDLGAVRREVAAYPDDASPWHALPGLPNCGGTLVLHLAGNLRHFVGAVLGGSCYVRDRDAEFNSRDLSRAELAALLEQTESEVARAMSTLDASRLANAYPIAIREHSVGTQLFLLHLVAHLTYHLGQLDVHRRVVTGDARSIDAVAIAPLA
jgi:uncharacterized damage-inducible protein DinB